MADEPTDMATCEGCGAAYDAFDPVAVADPAGHADEHIEQA